MARRPVTRGEALPTIPPGSGILSPRVLLSCIEGHFGTEGKSARLPTVSSGSHGAVWATRLEVRPALRTALYHEGEPLKPWRFDPVLAAVEARCQTASHVWAPLGDSVGGEGASAMSSSLSSMLHRVGTSSTMSVARPPDSARDGGNHAKPHRKFKPQRFQSVEDNFIAEDTTADDSDFRDVGVALNTSQAFHIWESFWHSCAEVETRFRDLERHASLYKPSAFWSRGFRRVSSLQMSGLLSERKEGSSRRGTKDNGSSRQDITDLGSIHRGSKGSAGAFSRSRRMGLKAGEAIDSRGLSNLKGAASDSSSDEGDEETVVLGSLRELCEAFKASSIPSLPVKLPPMSSWDEHGLASTTSSMQEVDRALQMLNFYRWLCGLEALRSDVQCMTAAEVVAGCLVAREKVPADATSPKAATTAEFAKSLCDFINDPRRGCEVLVLHREASLVEAIEESIRCATSNGGLPAGVNKRNHNVNFASETGLSVASHPDTSKPSYSAIESILSRVQHDGEPGSSSNSQMTVDATRCYHSRSESFEPSFLKFFFALESANEKVVSAQSIPSRSKTTPVDTIGRARGSRLRERPDGHPATCGFLVGDPGSSVSFRRKLLDPAAVEFGAHRYQDLCVFWLGMESRLGSSLGDAAVRRNFLGNPVLPPTTLCIPDAYPEFVVYPSPGVFPHELLGGSVPTWTIMPDARSFQPTHRLQVRMWRVRLPGSSSPEAPGVGGGNSRGRLERLEEVTIKSLCCDCSAFGTAFCISFQPALVGIEPGSEFEVLLSGLRGTRAWYHCFHQFKAFRGGRAESSLVKVARQTVDRLGGVDLWGAPLSTFCPMTKSDSATKGSDTREINFPEMGLITHPDLSFETSSADILIVVSCPSTAALLVGLSGARLETGVVELRRCTFVQKFGPSYAIHVKLPNGKLSYTLSFLIALEDNPIKLIPYPMQYKIIPRPEVPTLLNSLDNPNFKFFGFLLQTTAAQTMGAILLSPLPFRLPLELVYFLVCLDPASAAYAAACASVPHKTKLFSGRLAPPSKGTAEENAQHSASGCTSHLVSRQDHIVCPVAAMHSVLGEHLADCVQDSGDAVHIDLSVLSPMPHSGSPAHVATPIQRYMLRLRQRRDFFNLFEGHVLFGDVDAGCKVEMFMRTPESCHFKPFKLAEWIVAAPLLSVQSV